MGANYLRISGYTCESCGVMHREEDEDGLFALHYEANFPGRASTRKETRKALEALRKQADERVNG